MHLTEAIELLFDLCACIQIEFENDQLNVCETSRLRVVSIYMKLLI